MPGGQLKVLRFSANPYGEVEAVGDHVDIARRQVEFELNFTVCPTEIRQHGSERDRSKVAGNGHAQPSGRRHLPMFGDRHDGINLVDDLFGRDEDTLAHLGQEVAARGALEQALAQLTF